MDIKPIETTYNGYRFRSRLEARWAVFFDEVGIEYEYEPEGFKTTGWGEGEEEYYLPDFYLPNSKVWVEVKGDPEGLVKEHDRMVKLLDFGGVLPEFSHSDGTNRGLLLLGNIPYARDFSISFHPIIQHHKGLVRNWAFFSKEENDLGVIREDTNIFKIHDHAEIDPEAFRVETKTAGMPGNANFYHPLIKRGYIKARQARFEFGETP